VINLHHPELPIDQATREVLMQHPWNVYSNIWTKNQ